MQQTMTISTVPYPDLPESQRSAESALVDQGMRYQDPTKRYSQIFDDHGKHGAAPEFK